MLKRAYQVITMFLNPTAVLFDMCLAVPAKVVELSGNKAKVDFGGVLRDVDVSMVEVEAGHYVIVHAGFAIQVLEEEEALETLALFNEILDSAQ